ncbi:BtpA/SgcQ family protein [Thermanaerothrix sp.]|jgi:membrane complex biogenesis BtpA family protein|uniref:BtpA/SgcQ family protein n=1 Tax=Thermanaerothrix sp. TaxID=2972675 RepID=UPI002ADDEB0E|nr:BtpA/SgcQ family protein [Thermanaerothrix sp.]
MRKRLPFSADPPRVIAALHLPPHPASRHPMARSVSQMVDFALRNAERAVEAGIPALYIQDVADTPVAPQVQPHTIATLAVVGAAVRRAFPDLILGVCLMSHGAREPLAIAQAIGAQFVRLKVYVGAMVKAEGILQGCAYEAIQYRAQLGADEIAILADVYDRTGEPLGRLPLVEEARQAAVFGRADGLVLTGLSFEESLEMLGQVRAANLGVPLYLGGGANATNVSQALQVADGIIVSSAFKSRQGWTREALLDEWEPERIRTFMEAVQKAGLRG